jgi:hypothetical protein
MLLHLIVSIQAWAFGLEKAPISTLVPSMNFVYRSKRQNYGCDLLHIPVVSSNLDFFT